MTATGVPTPTITLSGTLPGGVTFSDNGSVSAVASSGSVSGAWSTGSDDSQPKLYLDFGAIAPWDDLNSDWHIIENTDSKIRLEDVSGGNGGTDLLTFEKN